MRNIIIDTDAGIDDISAILYLLMQAKINLRAITVSGTGLCHGPEGARNIQVVCNFLKTQIPIAYGRSKALTEAGTPFPEDIRKEIDGILEGNEIHKLLEKHNALGFQNVPIQASAIALLEEIFGRLDKVTLLCLGPLTNLAEFFARHPETLTKVESIVIMGGAIGVNGNIKDFLPDGNPRCEWNFYADPKAANIVFSLASNLITLVPLDATNQVPLTQDFYRQISRSENKTLRLIYLTFLPLIEKYGLKGFLSSFYLWDQLAAMICIDNTTVELKKNSLSVSSTDGEVKLVDPDHQPSTQVKVAHKVISPRTIVNRFMLAFRENFRHDAEKKPSCRVFAPGNKGSIASDTDPNNENKIASNP